MKVPLNNSKDFEEFGTPQQADLPNDVIPFYGTQKHSDRPPSRLKLGYDIVMLILLFIDLSLMIIDNILMSGFALSIANWLTISQALTTYQTDHHLHISALGGFFTLFWVIDLLTRWSLAVYQKTYYRWFFFPFVHWYEVLGVFPALRALRLLRAAVITKRLHRLGIQVIPKRWVDSAKFYYHLLLEELSDRVILTAIDNFRAQIARDGAGGAKVIHQTIERNRTQIELALLTLLRNELTPKLQSALLANHGEKLAIDIGQAVEKALTNTPELRKYLKLIPIAGGMIESQIHTIGNQIGQNVTTAVNRHLFDDITLDTLMSSIAHGVAQIDVSRPEIQILIAEIIEAVLNSFEEQVKTQQYHHKKQLSI